MESRNVWLTLLWTLSLLQSSDGELVRCDMPADVVFLLDASASIKPHEWEQEKKFVGVLIDALAVEAHAINVGLIVYSTEIGQVVDLQPFKTRAQLKAELPKLVQTSQGTHTASAISRMRQMMANQARPEAKMIAVLITDGRSENVTATIQEAVYARQLDGITMIALGVGSEVFVDELKEVAKSDFFPDQRRLFLVSNFAQLDEVVVELRDLICQVVPETTTTTISTTPTTPSTAPTTTPYLVPISCPRPADVIFLLDGSHSISDEDWATGRMFVTTLINSMEVDQEAIHAGIIVFSSGIGDTVPIKPFLGKELLKAKASGLRQPNWGRTNTAQGLQALRTMFLQHGRPGVPHIGLVITDGKSSNVQATMNEAVGAKGDGVVMVAVGVGEDTYAPELEAMASSRAMLFNVTDFSALFDIAQALRKIICITINSSTSSTTTTTTTTTIPPPTIPALCEECLVKGSIGYNSYPSDCNKYVVCYPEDNGGYRAEVKDCPFGLFWSTLAVSCLDAAFVNCTADPCRGQAEGWAHTRGSPGCGHYWVCRGGHSVPQCCPQGQRYWAMVGCSTDSTCTDRCSLQSTLAGSGSCTYRPNPDDLFSFLQVVPGSGHVIKPCSPGTVYDHNRCTCVFYTPSLACVPSVNYNFDGNFIDRSSHRHSAEIQRVLLTHNGTAYFNGTGHIKLNALPRDEFRDNFVLRLRYRLQPQQPPKVHWNDHYDWGMQDWFSSRMTQHQNMTFSDRPVSGNVPDPSLPSGQRTSTLERVVIMRNGTVVHGASTHTGGLWPGGEMSHKFVSKIHLGPMQDIKDAAVSGGVVYVPNNKGQVLVMSASTAPGSSGMWQIVAKDGRVMKSGTGQVPQATASNFQFQLRPPPITRWFIMTSNGIVLNTGAGTIPERIKNLYKGFDSGRLVKVAQIGEDVVEWSVSRPDGTGASSGQGSIPNAIREQLKLDQAIKPEGIALKRWAVLSSSGDVLESGAGDMPPGVMNKYSGMKSALVLADADSHWQLRRPDGTKLMEGAGTLPAGVTSFIRGSLVLPGLEQSSRWTATLPNGTTVSGTGPVPQHIKDLFEQTGASPRDRVSVMKQSRWYLTDASGKVMEAGYGQVPQDLAERYRDQGVIRMVAQKAKRGSSPARWEVRSQDGNVLSSGYGPPPPDVFKVAKETVIKSQTVAGGAITSGANVPSRGGTAGTMDQAGAGKAWGGGAVSSGTGTRTISRGTGTISRGTGTISRGTGTIPRGTGTISTGTGTIHRGTGTISTGTGAISTGTGTISRRTRTGTVSIQRDSRGGQRWSATLPDGSKRSGVGEIPVDIKAMIASQGGAAMGGGVGGGGRRGGAQGGRVVVRRPSGGSRRKWTVTMPDGSKRSGVGDIPADLQALLNAQMSRIPRETSEAGGLQRSWSIILPNGTISSGTGPIPPHLKSLLDAQSASGGVKTEQRWSVTMPDGSTRSGTGEMPAELKALMAQSQGVQRRWSVTMPDGSVRSGEGEMPADIKALVQNSGSTTLSRGRRASHQQQTEDIFGNCGHSVHPSYLLSTTQHDVTLTLMTKNQRTGASLTLPVSAGMNDVQFVYNGKTLTGFSNGVQKSRPLSGEILPVQAPLTIGRCRRGYPAFRGEIDEISLSSCIP